MGKRVANGSGNVEKEYLIILRTFVADVTEGWTRKPIRHRFDVTVSPRRIAVVILVGKESRNNNEMDRAQHTNCVRLLDTAFVGHGYGR